MHLIFSHCITISLLDDSILKNRLPPGTMIDVVVTRLIVFLFYITFIVMTAI